ncbi:MAG TPA: hypothetical protein VK209_12215 [Candidatus Sulfotelmatobacter sp.]|nr:hypothetical protein [Candidatus Sulfotelmatobacter sp.]
MNKLKVAASALGIFAGLGGPVHGPGEILQGHIAPGSIVFEAWPGFEALSGEPAMTIIPNLLITGIFAIIIGIVLSVWSAKFIDGKFGGLVMILLTVGLLLFGGGLIPPLFGFVAGILALVLNWRRVKGWNHQ